MQQQRVSLSSYQFRRSKCDGLIEVLNEGLYVMAEYSERTGLVKWQRVVAASQREQIEKWLGAHYPIQAEAQPVHSGLALVAGAGGKKSEKGAVSRRQETVRGRRRA